jgi:hypothetical protein
MATHTAEQLRQAGEVVAAAVHRASRRREPARPVQPEVAQAVA